MLNPLCMGIRGAFQRALEASDPLASAAARESLSQTGGMGPHPGSPLSQCPSLSVCLIRCSSACVSPSPKDAVLVVSSCCLCLSLVL